MALEGQVKLRSSLIRISNQLARHNLEDLKFLCRDVVPMARMETVSNAIDLFTALEEMDKLLLDDLEFLGRILTSIGRKRLLLELESDGFNVPVWHSNRPDIELTEDEASHCPISKEYLFTECLMKIAQELPSMPVAALSFKWSSVVPSPGRSDISAHRLFQTLQQRVIIAPDNPRWLYNDLHEIGRSDLAQKINDYLKKSDQEPYAFSGQSYSLVQSDCPQPNMNPFSTTTAKVECQIFQKHRELILEGIVNCAGIDWFADQMLQKNFVSTEIIQHTEQMSDKVRCGTLLDAVETQIKASPAQLQIFISTLEEQATMQTIADVLSNACSACSAGENSHIENQPFEPSDAQSQISIPQCNREFKVFLTNLIALLANHDRALVRMKASLSYINLPTQCGRLAKIIRIKRYQQAETVHDLFELLSPYWCYTECGLLQTIVRVSRCQSAIKEVNEFLLKRREVSKYFILQQADQPEHSYYSSTLLHHPHSVSPSNEAEIESHTTIRIKVNARILTHRGYNAYAELVCMTLGLPGYSLQLTKTGSGSIIITWSVHDELVPYVQHVLEQISDWELKLLASRGVTEISIGAHTTIVPPSIYWIVRDYHSLCLFRACAEDNLEEVTSLLKQGVDVNARDEEKQTALSLSCIHGYKDVTEVLLAAGADVDAADKNQWTSLMEASDKGHPEIVKLLLQANANPNLQSQDGRTPLMYSSAKGYTKIVSLLLEGGANVNMKNKHGWTALILASWLGCLDTVKLLLHAGADVECKDEWQDTPLICASQTGHGDIVKEFLKLRADVNAQGQSGNTALIRASENEHTSVVRELLRAQANPNIQNEWGESALMRACIKGHKEVVQLLIEARVDVNQVDKHGYTALLRACLWGHTEIVKMLVKAKADVDVQTEEGFTPLIVATEQGHLEVVERLLKANVNLNIVQKSTGWTALFFAAKEGQLEILQLLLKNGADFRMDLANLTPLHIARECGHTQVCEVLQQYTSGTEEPRKRTGSGGQIAKVIKESVQQVIHKTETLFKRLKERLRRKDRGSVDSDSVHMKQGL